MKVDQLMDAIEKIDDRYIEESAYGVRRKSHIPWGLIATAACFCLVIGATIFMQSMGILPHLTGPTDGTSQTVTTEPSISTMPTETTVPPETTLPQTNPTEPPQTTPPTSLPEIRPSVEEFFSNRENWQNHLILLTFSDPTQIDLRPSFLRTMDGESTYATNLEHEKLSTVVPGYDRNKLFRATKAQLDEVMLALFDITTDQLATDWESHFTYLAETGCYYGRANIDRGYSVYIDRIEECDDGTVLMYYALASGEEPYMVARLQPHETGYYILSNQRYVDNTGKSEDQITMETLFRAFGWYNQALTNEYDSPEQLGLYSFFYCGFDGEPKVTDAELAELKYMQGFGTPVGDICRLSPDKMNAVLTECFGITLEDVDPLGFNGLAYLESTNCYYFKASSPNFIQDFKADKVEEQSDGTIDIYYNISYKGDYVVTVKPHGDGYRILSNRCINATSSFPSTPSEPTGDAELEKLFFNRSEMPEKESSQKMLDAFLADPDTFVRLLAKQNSSYGVMGVLSRNITAKHPQINAYRAAIAGVLAKELPEREKSVVNGMAAYSGLSNYIGDIPGTADYEMVLGVTLHYGYAGETAELLRQFCITDPAGMIAVMAQDKESWSLYIEPLTFFASQEELKQLKQSMTQLIAELNANSGSEVQDQIKCAQKITEGCDKNIEEA